MPKNIINKFKNILSNRHGLNDEKIRANRILHTSITGVVAKLLAVLNGIVTVPYTLPYLGTELFGFWMFLTGVISLMAFSDLGLSIGLKSSLARCFSLSDESAAQEYISSALALLANVSVSLIILVFVIDSYDLWSIFIVYGEQGVTDTVHTTAKSLILVFAIGLPSTAIHRALEGYQRGSIANIALCIGRILALLSVFFCIYFDAPLPIMASLYLGLPMLALYVVGSIVAMKSPWLRPILPAVRKQRISELLNIGKLALRAQFGATVMASGPLIILTTAFGAIAITPYAITKRMFDAVTMLLSELLSPLWPAYGEAYAKKDYLWIIDTFKKSLFFSIAVFVPIFVVLTIFGQQVILLWSQELAAVPSFELLMLCNVWIFLLLIIRVLSVFLNGINAFEGQAKYGLYLPIFAMLIGWYVSQSMALEVSLLAMIVIGEAIRVIFMMKECAKHLVFFKSTYQRVNH